MAELDAQIGLTADASGVEAGVGRAKKSLASLGASATKMGQDVAGAGDKAGKALSGLGDGGEKSAKKIERDTKSMQSSIQRYIATLEAGSKDSRKYWETMADFKGVDKNALRPLLDQLESYKGKANEARVATMSFTEAFGVVRALTVGASVFGLAVQFGRVADEITGVNSRLKLVTSSTQELYTAQTELYKIAQASRVSYTGLADTFAQMSRATKELGVTQKDMLAITKTISQAVTISGGSAQSAQAALVQLSQGFASGTLRGEELNSVLEQTPRLAQAIAQGLGVTTGQLRAMGQAGELTAGQVVEALKNSAAKVQSDFDQMGTTIEQSTTQAANSLVKMLGVMDDVTNASSGAAGAISKMAAGMDIFTASVQAMRNADSLGDLFLAAFRNNVELNDELKRSEDELAKLSAVLAKAPQNIYVRSQIADLKEYVAWIKDAQERLARLGGAPASVSTDPRDQSSFKSRTSSYQDYARQQADSEKALIEVRMRAAGVNKQYLADLKTYQDALKLGTMDHAQYIKAVSDLATTTYKSSAAGKEAEKGLKSGASEAKKAANEYQRLIDSINAKIAAEELELAGGEKLTDSQRLRVQFAQELQTSLKGLSAAKVAEYTADLNRLESLERENTARKEFLQIAEQERQQRLKIAQAAEQSVESLSTGNQQLRDEIQLIGLSAAEQMEVIRLREEAVLLVKEQHLAEMQRADDLTGTMTRERIALEQEIELRRERLNLMGDKATKEQFAESNREMTREWQRTVDQYGDVFRQGFADMLNNGKDGWKSFTRSLVTTFKTTVADAIYKMFAQPFVVNIVGNLMGITGGGAGGAALQMASGGGSSALGLAGNAYSLFGAGGVGGSLMAGAGWLTGATTLGGSLTAGASLLGTGTLAGGAAGLGMIAGAIAPIALAAAALGNVFGLFRKTEKRGYGLMGTLGEEEGVHSLDLMRKGGSLFGGPKWFVRDTGVSEMDKALQDTYKQQRDALMKMGEALGLATDHVKDFTVQLGSDELGDKKVRGIRLDGLSDEEAQKKIAEALATANNEIAQQIIGTWERTVREVERIDISRPTDVGDTTDYGVPNVIRESIVDERYIPSEFARDGEQAIDTLTRLATSLTGVNTAFENLGVTLYEASLAGGDMASQLVDLFGGLEQFSQSTGVYMQNFYSADEQRDVVRRQLQRAFEGLDLQLPDIDATNAREQFRAIAEAQDLTTESGRETWAALMNLSGAFASVTQSSEDAAAAAKQLADDAAAAAKQAAEQAAELAARIAEKELDLQIQLLRAQGQELAAVALERRRELDALAEFGPAAQSMQQQIWAIIDATARLEAGAAAYFAEVDRQAAQQGYVGDAQAALDKMFGAVNAGAAAAAQASADAASAAAASWRSAAQSIQSAIDKLRAQTTAELDPAARYAATKAEFDALTVAALGGDADAAVKLSGAADAFLEASKSGSATQAEYMRDRVLAEAKLAGVLETSNAQASLQESIASSASAAASELTRLNENLTGFAGALYELLSKSYQGTDRETAQGVAEKFAGMQADFDSYFRTFAQGSTYTDAVFNGGSFTRLSGDMAAYTGSDGVISYLRATESILDVAKRIPELREAWEKQYGLKLPAFAAGGLHTGGLRVVGERGWEIEATGPARIWNQQQIAGALAGGGNAEVVDALRVVSRQLDRLEQRLAAIEDSNDQMAGQQDNVTEGGNGMRAEIMNVKALAQAIKEAAA